MEEDTWFESHGYMSKMGLEALMNSEAHDMPSSLRIWVSKQVSDSGDGMSMLNECISRLLMLLYR